MRRVCGSEYGVSAAGQGLVVGNFVPNESGEARRTVATEAAGRAGPAPRFCDDEAPRSPSKSCTCCMKKPWPLVKTRSGSVPGMGIGLQRAWHG
eukprot:scaffold22609_cov62-Phaeocystis_antarctica.AAC.3